MTLELMTKSHGYIESGFCFDFMKLSRIGKYSFEVKNLCELIKTLAENPKITQFKITGYDTEKYWELEEKYEKISRRKCIESITQNEPEEFESFLKENSTGLSESEKTQLLDNLKAIPVIIDYKNKIIKIGEYEIENGHFICLMTYLLNGGFCGWLNDKKPFFVEDTLIALGTSKSPLFKR